MIYLNIFKQKLAHVINFVHRLFLYLELQSSAVTTKVDSSFAIDSPPQRKKRFAGDFEIIWLFHETWNIWFTNPYTLLTIGTVQTPQVSYLKPRKKRFHIMLHKHFDMTSPPQFKILPISIPTDIPSLLRINYHVTIQDPLHQAKTSLISESEYISSGMPGAEKQFCGENAYRNRMAKMVLNDPSKSDGDMMVVSYIVWKTPLLPQSAKSESEIAAAFAQEIAELQVSEGVDRDLVVRLKTEYRALNKKYLGEDYESRYWELDALATLSAYQRMGLGSRLVKWGLDMLEAAMKAKPGEVDGAYLVASPAGSSTYRKAGFVEIGEQFVNVNGQEPYRHCWFVKRFENNQQHSETNT